MNTTNPDKIQEQSNIIEKKALDNLLRCSKRPEKLEKTVSIKDWDAVSNWSSTRPMCYYVDNMTSKKDKKKGSTKQSQSSGKCSNLEHNNKSFSSKLQDGKKYSPKQLKLFSKEKCKHFEIPLIKETLSDDYSKNSNPLIRNKFSRSTNVLSYETASWRFLVDSNDFNYVERSTPKEKVCSFLKRTKSSLSIHKNQSYKGSKQQVLDPAGFLDEQITVAYKSYRSFQPNLEIRQLLKRIDNNNRQIQHTQIHERLYVTSFIKKLSPIYDGESDGNEGSVHNKPTKESTKTRKKKIKKKIKKKPSSGAQNLNSKKVVLPRIDTTLSINKGSHTLKPSFITKENIKFKKATAAEELYLPLLNHSNYTNKLQYLKRPDVKLPPVAGIKISLSATSSSGLVS